jgi:glycosyltransferase involved in cell wall biosynthesis
MKIIFLGFNSFKEHKRGVENVIDFQSKAFDFEKIYYFHWGTNNTVSKYHNYICISIKHYWLWPIMLNLVLFRIFKKNDTLIHSHNSLFSLISIFKTDIFTVHDGVYYLSKSKKEKISPFFLIVERLVYLRCTLVHFISNYTKEQTLFGKRRNFVIIPNTSHFEELVTPTTLRTKDLYQKNVLVVRSIEERARIDLVIDVAEQLQGKNYQFNIAGKGPLLEHFRTIIRKRNITNVVMLGYVEDNKLLNLYSTCDFVLMVAEYGEGFGLPIIEGYLFNKPVIASNKCAIPEVIISEKYLFSNNVPDILKSIEFVSNGVNDRFDNYYKENYSNLIVLAKYKDIYLKLLSC